jgi:hypothetical protein
MFHRLLHVPFSPLGGRESVRTQRKMMRKKGERGRERGEGGEEGEGQVASDTQRRQKTEGTDSSHVLRGFRV